MRRPLIGAAMMAHHAALLSVMEVPPNVPPRPIAKADPPEGGEKVSRQRKRWLQRQARKAERRNRK